MGLMLNFPKSTLLGLRPNFVFPSMVPATLYIYIHVVRSPQNHHLHWFHHSSSSPSPPLSPPPSGLGQPTPLRPTVELVAQPITTVSGWLSTTKEGQIITVTVGGVAPPQDFLATNPKTETTVGLVSPFWTRWYIAPPPKLTGIKSTIITLSLSRFSL